MKTLTPWIRVVVTVAVTSAALWLRSAEPVDGQSKTLDVLAMKSMPVGHFLANLRFDGTERRVNFKVGPDSIRAVRSNDERLVGLEGKPQFIGNGVFLVSLANGRHRATQFWVFAPDGSVAIKEIPDRGENQRGVAVADDSIEPPVEVR
ncbi:MAG: hypothetical protein ACYDC1_12205 [Limisphaerales bacterium]